MMPAETTTRSVTIDYVEVYSVYIKGRPLTHLTRDLQQCFRTYDEAFDSAARAGIEAFNVGKQFVRSDVAERYFNQEAE